MSKCIGVALVVLVVGCGSGEDMPSTARELCDAVSITTCHLEHELECGVDSILGEEWCDDEEWSARPAGWLPWVCCNARNCSNEAPLSEAEVQGCLDAVAELNCTELEIEQVPYACLGG